MLVKVYEDPNFIATPSSPETYIFNRPIFSPLGIGASIGPLYSITALIVFFFRFGIVR